MLQLKSAIQAIKEIKSGDHLFFHGAAATPKALIDLLMNRAPELENVTIYHLHTEGEAFYVKPEFKKNFRIKNLFIGSNIRPYIDFDRVDYIPAFLSEMPNLFRSGQIRIDFAFVQTSIPDKNGFVSLGTSVDTVKAAALSAKYIVAEMNRQMPYVLGDGILHLNQIYAATETNRGLYESTNGRLTEDERKIGQYVSELVDDGACLQLGIGNIPNAVLAHLNHHKNLGLHSEMCSDGVLPLIESGALNNSMKRFHRGKSVCSFVMGTHKLYDHLDHNPNFYLLEADYVNNPTVIARNPKVVAINSAIEVDLSGQVCADSVGNKVISGVGGQVDFIRGATLSPGGKPIIAMLSRSKKGFPRIVAQLQKGAGVVTTRAHIHFVVTEYGAIDLSGKSVGERARSLIQLAHPEDREKLEKDFHQFLLGK